MDEQKQDAQVKTIDAVFGLTLPPAGIKFIGTGFKMDINGAVLAIASDMLHQNTAWKAADGRMVLAGNILMRTNTIEEMRTHLHAKVDTIIDAWVAQNKKAPGMAGIHVINPEDMTEPDSPAVPEEPLPQEQQPASEALDDIASGKTKTLEVESELSPSGARVD